MFVVGLWIGALAYVFANGALFAVALPGSWPLMAVAGLLVGVGTRMGGGCTSGHGVCGIARFSKRSLWPRGFIASAWSRVIRAICWQVQQTLARHPRLLLLAPLASEFFASARDLAR